MHTNVHCTELKTVFLIETVHKFICLENFQCTVLLIEIKRKIGNSIFNRTVCLIESTEQFLNSNNANQNIVNSQSHIQKLVLTGLKIWIDQVCDYLVKLVEDWDFRDSGFLNFRIIQDSQDPELQDFSGLPGSHNTPPQFIVRESFYPGTTMSSSVSPKNLSFSSAVISMWSFSRHFEQGALSSK